MTPINPPIGRPMNPGSAASGEDAVMLGLLGDGPLTQELLTPIWTPRPALPFLLSGAGALLFFSALFYTFFTGIGTWGNNIPVAWAFGITNFVWWIGIGHAGTFISAFLLLLEQQSWRTSINRIAEAMTLFALVNAGLYPVAHLGRAWFAYWLVPYPSTMGVWPQFRSSLTWDIAAVSTYFTVSLLFWYLGLVPDLAAARDSAPTLLRRRIYGVFALGWRGSARHFRHYRMAYGLLGGLATPLVVSVHSIVSTDFAIAKLPGWHSTIFPPYFVAGAIFSGFAMVFTLLLPTRRALGLERVITAKHLDNMARITLLTGSIVAYSYLVEHYMAWAGGEGFESEAMNRFRPFGPYAGIFWTQIFCNVLVPQVLWFRRARRSAPLLFVVSVLINVGMWTERFTIIAGTLTRDFLPSAWHLFHASLIDWTLLFGSMSLFVFLYLLFLRFVPAVPIAEAKELAHHLRAGAAHGGGT
jgi:molybdopterin-containing oxidoreductase family membrane subunit